MMRMTLSPPSLLPPGSIEDHLSSASVAPPPRFPTYHHVGVIFSSIYRLHSDVREVMLHSAIVSTAANQMDETNDVSSKYLISSPSARATERTARKCWYPRTPSNFLHGCSGVYR